jgi:hypothetical protein
MPPGPTASIAIEPPVAEPGKGATLRQSATNSTAVTVRGLGAVAVEGKQEIRPLQSTTDELVADCAGGSTVNVATLRVTALPPRVDS